MRRASFLCRSLMVGFALAAAWCGIPAAATPDQCGDADASGTRTVTDGVLVLRTAAQLSGGCRATSHCDVDGNGAVTVTDGVAALRLAAGLDAPLACRNVVVDHSRFTIFTFNRRSAFGFCPPLDSASQIILSVVAGGVERHAVVIVEGTPGDPGCDPEIMTEPPVACAKEVALPDRLLSADELARVEAAFATVTVEQQQHPDCRRITFDPCLIDEYTWDASTITDFVCGQPRLLSDQSAALNTVLDSLR